MVEAEGFSAASRQTGKSKAILSKYVRDLEDTLGVRLLNRTTRRVSLTEAGETYYAEAKAILDQLSALETAIADQASAPRGHLKISAPRTYGEGLLGASIMEFAGLHPDLTLDLRFDDRIVDLVAEGFDVAIRITELSDSSLVARKLAPFRILVCAHPDVIARYGMPETPEALAALPCIIDTNVRIRNAWPFLGPDGQRRTVRVQGRIEVNSPHAGRLAARAGLGFAFIPEIVVEDDLTSGALVPVLEGFEYTGLGIYAVFAHREHVPGKLRAFVDHLVERFGRPLSRR